MGQLMNILTNLLMNLLTAFAITVAMLRFDFGVLEQARILHIARTAFKHIDTEPGAIATGFTGKVHSKNHPVAAAPDSVPARMPDSRDVCKLRLMM